VTGTPPQYQPRTQEEMAKYLELVKNSVGFDEKRGDQVQLENIQFDKSLELQNIAELEKQSQNEWIVTGAMIFFGTILVLWFLFKVLLPLVRWVTATVDPIPGQLGGTPTPEQLEAMEEEMRLAQQAQENVEIRKSVGGFVDTDPKYAAAILRKWMRERN